MSIARDGLSIKLAEFLSDQSFRNDATEPGTAQIVMLRGCKVNADGSLSAQSGAGPVTTNRYDDVLAVFGQKTGGQPYAAYYEATAQPGRVWVKHSSYNGIARGCPTVQPGQYRYKRGTHRGHRAMVQAGSPVCVIRDIDQDGVIEASDRVDYPIWTGINIHAGGLDDIVDWDSSGCQVIRGGWGGNAWTQFYHIIYSVAKKQDIFHYALVDFAEFGRWHDAADRAMHKLLRFGSHGKHVAALQAMLSRAGYYGAAICDGEFGRVTDEGLRAWQKATGQQPTGMVERLS